MKCDKVIDCYLKSEDIEKIPLRVRIHTFFCPACKIEILKLSAMFIAIEERSLWRTERNITGNVMDAIQWQKVYSEKRISGKKWVIIGAVIFSSIFLINFSESFLWLKEQFGSDFLLPVSIVLGLVLTVYLMVLTGSNYDVLEKYLKIYKNVINKRRG